MSFERSAINRAMQDAEAAAWRSLAGYKFWMFGYHAAAWVKLNRLLPASDRRENPFRDLVKFAKRLKGWENVAVIIPERSDAE